MIAAPEHGQQLACMLVELDTIYDTRAGTLARMGKDVYVKAIAQGYFGRTSDHFPDVNSAEFQKLYRERDCVTLSRSMTTQIISLIKDFVARVNVTSLSAPVKKVPRIDINIYPYEIPEPIIDNIVKALKAVINDRVEVGWVRYSPEDLHYDLLKHTYDHAIMYSIGPLIEAQAQDWEKRNRGIPDLTIFTPVLCHAPNKEDVPEDITAMASEVERSLAPVLNVMQIPVQFFCTVLDPRMLAVSSAPEGAPEKASDQSS
jgi:hypothetical protein